MPREHTFTQAVDASTAHGQLLTWAPSSVVAVQPSSPGDRRPLAPQKTSQRGPFPATTNGNVTGNGCTRAKGPVPLDLRPVDEHLPAACTGPAVSPCPVMAEAVSGQGKRSAIRSTTAPKVAGLPDPRPQRDDRATRPGL